MRVRGEAAAEAEAKIKALVGSGALTPTTHLLNSQHWSEATAQAAVSSWSKGKKGLGVCSYFALAKNDRPYLHKTDAEKLVAPAQPSKMNGEFFKSKQQQNAEQATYKADLNKAQYRKNKNDMRKQVEASMLKAYDNKVIDKALLIKSFLLQKQSDLYACYGSNDSVEIYGPIPYGYVGYIITPGASTQAFTDEMLLVISGDDMAAPLIINAYPVHMQED